MAAAAISSISTVPAARRTNCKACMRWEATCSNPGTPSYSSSYDPWGNVVTRTSNKQTATLSYDQLDQLIEWQVPSTNSAWDAYDASGNRTLQRTTSGGSTQITIYAFGLKSTPTTAVAT